MERVRVTPPVWNEISYSFIYLSVHIVLNLGSWELEEGNIQNQ